MELSEDEVREISAVSSHTITKNGEQLDMKITKWPNEKIDVLKAVTLGAFGLREACEEMLASIRQQFGAINSPLVQRIDAECEKLRGGSAPVVPTDYEIKILRHLNGEQFDDLSWGGAMGACVEFLQGSGYATRGSNVKITDKGKDLLERLGFGHAPQEPCLHPHASYDNGNAYCPDCGESMVIATNSALDALQRGC